MAPAPTHHHHHPLFTPFRISYPFDRDTDDFSPFASHNNCHYPKGSIRESYRVVPGDDGDGFWLRWMVVVLWMRCLLCV